MRQNISHNIGNGFLITDDKASFAHVGLDDGWSLGVWVGTSVMMTSVGDTVGEGVGQTWKSTNEIAPLPGKQTSKRIMSGMATGSSSDQKPLSRKRREGSIVREGTGCEKPQHATDCSYHQYRQGERPHRSSYCRYQWLAQ